MAVGRINGDFYRIKDLEAGVQGSAFHAGLAYERMNYFAGRIYTKFFNALLPINLTGVLKFTEISLQRHAEAIEEIRLNLTNIFARLPSDEVDPTGWTITRIKDDLVRNICLDALKRAHPIPQKIASASAGPAARPEDNSRLSDKKIIEKIKKELTYLFEILYPKCPELARPIVDSIDFNIPIKKIKEIVRSHLENLNYKVLSDTLMLLFGLEFKDWGDLFIEMIQEEISRRRSECKL